MFYREDQVPIKVMTAPSFPLATLKAYVMEALADGVRKGTAHCRDPIGGSYEDLFMYVPRVSNRLAVSLQMFLDLCWKSLTSYFWSALLINPIWISSWSWWIHLHLEDNLEMVRQITGVLWGARINFNEDLLVNSIVHSQILHHFSSLTNVSSRLIVRLVNFHIAMQKFSNVSVTLTN